MKETPIVSGGMINGYSYGEDFEAVERVTVEPGGTVTRDFEVPAPER
jgi:hypothetical protein